MENLMEALRIVSGSGPIAAMVVGTVAGVVIRRSFHQAMKNELFEKMERSQGSQAVVVQGRQRREADD